MWSETIEALNPYDAINEDMKKRRTSMKGKINEWLKLFVLCLTMLFGFALIYAIAWMAFGLPLNTWTLLLLFGIAGLSEYGWFRWAMA